MAGRMPFLRAWDFAGLVPKMAGLDAVRFLGSYVAKYFRDPKIRQVYDFHSLFIGGDPDRVPAIYAAHRLPAGRRRQLVRRGRRLLRRRSHGPPRRPAAAAAS